MPNYCYNYAKITGKTEDVEKLRKAFLAQRGDGFTEGIRLPFNEFCRSLLPPEADVPYSSEVSERYMFGTKWWHYDVIDAFGEPEDGVLEIVGDSAWSPPSELLRLLSLHHDVEIHLQYEEPGEDFAGWTTFVNGVENDECYTYAEFKWIDDRDSFLEYVEHYAENGYPFDEFQQIVLDEFVNALNDVDLEMIRKWYEECLEK
jgi:hypothetical protein